MTHIESSGVPLDAPAYPAKDILAKITLPAYSRFRYTLKRQTNRYWLQFIVLYTYTLLRQIATDRVFFHLCNFTVASIVC